MRRRKVIRALVSLLVVVGIGALMPTPARAVPRNEPSCKAIGVGAAGCYFRCVRNRKINVTVENLTNGVSVTGTVRCGGTTKSPATTSGQAPPMNFDSGDVVVKTNYTPDDSIATANCHTDTAPGATIRIQCAPARHATQAGGGGPFNGSMTFSPGLTLVGGASFFAMTGATPVMQVVDPMSGQVFVGPVSITGSGASDPSLLAESCGFGEGDLSMSFFGSGTGSLSGSGTGRYERVGTGARYVVAVDNLTVNGQASQSVTFELTGSMVPHQPCGFGPVTSAQLTGMATIGA